jgi:hypothetical protein
MDIETVNEYLAKWKGIYHRRGNCAEEQDAWDLYYLAKKAYEAEHGKPFRSESQLWDAYVDAKRMHELAQDTYDAAQRQEQDHGHRNS